MHVEVFIFFVCVFMSSVCVCVLSGSLLLTRVSNLSSASGDIVGNLCYFRFRGFSSPPESSVPQVT